jgi:hypothetical protein
MIRLPFICFLLLAYSFKLFAQSASSSLCSNAVGICSTNSYSFPAGVNAGSAVTGPAYGCLTTQPNPAWFFLQIKNNGAITFTMTSNPAKDIDYVICGPFSNPTAACGSSLISSKIVSCSYSTASTEIATIPNGITGEYYIILITNYSNKATNISFAQTSGLGSSNCDILCNITSLTAISSACQSGTGLGTYSITGTVTTFTPPDTGSLTISSSCGASVSFNAPFSSPLSYTLPNTAGHGDTCILTAVYSKVNTCSKSVSIITPTCCNVSASQPASICESQNLSFTATGTSGGAYHWSGPSGFTSTQQNPSIPNITQAKGGTYQVYLVNGACTTPTSTVNVTVKAKPFPKDIVHQ